jgi:hypothetical protein
MVRDPRWSRTIESLALLPNTHLEVSAMPTPCPSCQHQLSTNNGRRVKTKAPVARAFCRACGFDTQWVEGRRAEALAAAGHAAKASRRSDKATTKEATE